MAATCGVGLNNAMATAVNMLGDVHGGAGEQCAELYYGISDKLRAGQGLNEAVTSGLDDWRTQYGRSSRALGTGSTNPSIRVPRG